MAVRAIAAAPLLALLVTSAQQSVPPSVRYEQHVFAGGNPPPAGSLENPFKGDKRSAADGEKLFSAFNCDGCHSLGAVGGQGPSSRTDAGATVAPTARSSIRSISAGRVACRRSAACCRPRRSGSS